jgi:hypothetical protein
MQGKIEMDIPVYFILFLVQIFQKIFFYTSKKSFKTSWLLKKMKKKNFSIKHGDRKKQNIPRTAKLSKLFFPYSFLKLYSQQAKIKFSVKKIQKIDLSLFFI